MTHAFHPGPKPAAEELMAYADGELDGRRREQVAQWIAGNPEAEAEVEDLRRLSRAWQLALPPEPTAQAWDAALVRIETSVPAGRPQRPALARRSTWTYSGLAAAAVIGLVLLSRSLGPTPSPGPAGLLADDDEPFPVAQAHEINIVRMDARDADALVGHPPLSGNLVFADNDDVHLVHVRPLGSNGRMARMEAGSVPMIVAGPALGPGDR
jgi:anti-sigma factor RsiW